MRRMYSKKQVEEIAQNAVSSGTKLYLHTVEIDDEDDNDFVLYIITNFSNNITRDTQLSSNDNSFISCNIGSDEANGLSIYPLMLQLNNTHGGFTVVYLSEEGTFATTTFDFVNVDDTVTEL